MSEAVKLHQVKKGTAFTFQGDTNRPKTVYWFGKCDGMYAQVFETHQDYKKFNKPAFVDCSSVVIEETL